MRGSSRSSAWRRTSPPATAATAVAAFGQGEKAVLPPGACSRATAEGYQQPGQALLDRVHGGLLSHRPRVDREVLARYSQGLDRHFGVHGRERSHAN